MKFLKKLDLKHLFIVLIASLLITIPYFFYSPKQGLMAVLVLMMIALVSKVTFGWIAVYSIFINLFFLHLVSKWGRNSLVSRIQASYESATYERWEYFKTYFGLMDVLLMLAYSLVALLAIFFIVKQEKVSTFTRNISLVVSGLLIAVSLLIFPALETLRNFQLVHLPLSVYTTYDNLSIINKREEFLKSAKKEIRNCPSSFNKIIFIQGESVNKHHLSQYGYNRKTMPFLDSIEPTQFEAISPANQTRFSIPIILTPASVENFKTFYHSKSIVGLLSECGYSTYWISNQGKTGEYATTGTSIASEADYTYFLNDLDYTTAGLDGNILKQLDKIDTKGNVKQAIFIHLLGSHVSYGDRYPKESALLETTDEDSEENLIAQYDNSIYYTDKIISEIYKRVNNDNALYIYLSDHGEIISEMGHGFSPSFKEEYEIPLFIWSKKQEKITEIYKEAKGKTINVESIFHILKFLSGIDNKLEISYSSKVLSVLPENIVDYSLLPKHAEKN